MSPNKVAYGKCPWLCDLLALRIIQYFSFTDGETTKAILGYIIWTEESCVVLSAACRRPECYQMLPGTWVGSGVTRDVKQPPSSSAQQPHWWQLLRKISLLIYFFPPFHPSSPPLGVGSHVPPSGWDQHIIWHLVALNKLLRTHSLQI